VPERVSGRCIGRPAQTSARGPAALAAMPAGAPSPAKARVRKVALATDCSGMETPVMALQNLGVPVNHVFSCDIDHNAKKTIMANFPPKAWYDDLTARSNRSAPKSDLYVAGFPCQPFSMAGLHQGFRDARGRGTIFFKVRDYIVRQKPSAFVLENVSGLLRIQGGKYFEDIMASLRSLREYNVQAKLLNTRDHGVPQNRLRIYFIGIKKSVDRGTFEFPEALTPVSIERFLQARRGRPKASALPPRSQGTARDNVVRALKELQAKGRDPFLEPWVVDCDSTRKRMAYFFNHTPCMTCGRADGHWITNRGRRMNKTEMLRLQGMPTPSEGFKVVVSERALGRQVGNAMSCNVLERLFVSLLPAARLARAGSLVDRWAAKARSLEKAAAVAGKDGSARRSARTAAANSTRPNVSPLLPLSTSSKSGGVSRAAAPAPKKLRKA